MKLALSKFRIKIHFFERDCLNKDVIKIYVKQFVILYNVCNCVNAVHNPCCLISVEYIAVVHCHTISAWM